MKIPSQGTGADSATVTANAELRVGSNKIDIKLVVPTQEVPPESLLPTLHELSNHIMNGVIENAAERGQSISCRAGCGACCRQHVPISHAEARLLSAIVENLPEPEQSEIRQRFKTAVATLDAAGLTEKAADYLRFPREEVRQMVHDYFALGIACPFLVDESCSIYEYRPLICREYVVVSSPDHCASLNEEGIKRLGLPASVSSTFAGLKAVQRAGENRYVPLILALEWVERHPDDIPLQKGTQWVQDFFNDLTGSEIPDPDPLM